MDHTVVTCLWCTFTPRSFIKSTSNDTTS